jgi:hypothetical protein
MTPERSLVDFGREVIDRIKNLFRTRPPTEAELEAQAELKVIRERANTQSAENPMYGNR